MIVLSLVMIVIPTVFVPWSAKRRAAAFGPFCSIRKNWSSMPPRSASTRFSRTATTFAAGSIWTSVTLPMSMLLALASAGKSWRQRIAGGDRKALALKIGGRFDPRLLERDDAEAGCVEERHHRPDLGALRGGQHEGSGIRHPEGVRAGRDRLSRGHGPAPLVDRQVDAFLGEEAFLLAVVERRVEAPEIPVEAKRNRIRRDGDGRERYECTECEIRRGGQVRA